MPMTQDFEWNNAYSVGHQLLDKQHQQLLRLCKRVRVKWPRHFVGFADELELAQVSRPW
jgi:hemerythrin